MPKRAKSTLRKGWEVIVNGNLPKACGDWAKVGDLGTIVGRYRPDCWPYDEVYQVEMKRAGIIGTLHRNYIDQV